MDPTKQDGEQAIINFSGEKVGLGPHCRALMPIYQKRVNDFEVTRTLDIGFRPATLEAEEAWYERLCRSDNEVAFAIYEPQTLRPIGSTGLHRIDHKARTAEYGILIGLKDCWGKG